MTSEALKAGKISTQSIKKALATTKGDLFQSAGLLRVAVRELDRYIRASEELQVFAATIEKVKQDADYDKMSNDAFKTELDRRSAIYKVDALEEIYKIATMPNPETAAEMEVKLKAAIKLLGKEEQVVVNNVQSVVLQELNSLYLQNAPRIKSVRAVQIEYENAK